MTSRGTRLRTKVIALLLSLVALWGFAAFVTLRDGLNLLWVTQLDAGVGQPSESVVDALQHERRAAVVYLAGGANNSDARAALDQARQRTDETVEEFRELASGSDVDWAATEGLDDRVTTLLAKVDRLGEIRQRTDERTVGRDSAARTYTDMVDANFALYAELSTLDDDQIARYGRSLITLSRSRELLAQQDTLIAGALITGRLTATEISVFAQLTGARRLLEDEVAVNLPDSGVALYQTFTSSEAYTRYRAVEERIVGQTQPGEDLPVTVDTWQAAAQGALDGLRQLILDGADDALTQAQPVAIWVIVRLVLAGGLGLLAVIASIILSITTARALVRQLERLRAAAWRLAHEQLPEVVARIGRGDKVDVKSEAPPLDFGSDEIGQVGQAFNEVQRTAIAVAVQQAELRRNVRDVFLSLARRTQGMVHRQITLLDEMERQDHDPALLEQLYGVDHLATRMRRNAENLIVLSGAAPGRAWRRPVPMVDVVRGAVGEVEEYQRVTVLPIAPLGLAGRAVGDTIHLLAELVENALTFSPPDTGVQVSGQMVANGYALEIEDRGLGMSDEDRAAANARIAEPPEFNLAGAAQLGLYVVSRLAERHGIQVRLKDSPYGGTTAVVLIPRGLVVGAEDDDEQPFPDVLLDQDVPSGNGRSRMPALNGATRPTGTGPAAPPAGGGGGVAVAQAVTTAPVPGGNGAALTGSGTAEPDEVDEATVGGAGQVPANGAVPQATPANGGSADRAADRRTSGGPVRRERDGDRTMEVPVITSGTPTPQPADAQGPNFTPSGLPVRKRRSSFTAHNGAGLPGGAPPVVNGSAPGPAEASATAPGGGAPGAGTEPDFGRSPEDVRRLMSSYQAGTRRGRTEAIDPAADNPSVSPVAVGATDATEAVDTAQIDTAQTDDAPRAGDQPQAGDQPSAGETVRADAAGGTGPVAAGDTDVTLPGGAGPTGQLGAAGEADAPDGAPPASR